MEAKLVIDGKEYLMQDLTQGEQTVAKELAMSQQRSNEAQMVKNRETVWQEFLVNQLRESLAKTDQKEMDV